MFEELYASPALDATAHRRWALPAAVTLQAALAAVMVAYAIFHVEAVPPPIVMLGFFCQPPEFHPPPAAPERQATPPRTATAADTHDDGPKAPSEPPDGVKPGDPEPPEVPQTGGGGGGVTGGDPGAGNDDGGGGILGTPPPRQVLQAWQVHPPKILTRVEPVYPQAAAAMGLAGRVVVELVVDETGRVESARVVQSSSPIFEEAALYAVRRWTFTRPLDKAGQQVACYLTVTVSFRLR